MTTIKDAKWKLITHTMSKTKEHKMLVGYQSRGIGGLNKIFFLAPLYNLNDSNMDGSISMWEWAISKNFYDPYSVFELFNSANDTCCTMDAAVQLRDLELWNKTKEGILKASHKAASKALITISIEKILSPGIERSLALTKLNEIGKFSSSLLFLVQTGMETAVDFAINKSRGF